MPRYALVLEYDGRPFVGWQRQDNGPSVQAALALATGRFCGESPDLVAAGRTDAGVHASGQVVHLDLARPVDPGRMRDALNHHLRPAPVAVLEARPVPDDFHARFDATARVYRYRILTRRAPPTLERGLVWHHPHRLNAALMHDAGQLLVGRHDFTSFRATACQSRSPLKSIDLLHVRRQGLHVELHVRARSFLHHQVRNIVGSLALVGAGRRPLGWIAEALAARDRSAAGPTAPPDGLCLVQVRYPGWSSTDG